MAAIARYMDNSSNRGIDVRRTRENEVYLDFVNACVRDCEEPKARISQSAAWEHFRFWARSNGNWLKPKKQHFQYQMSLILGETVPGLGWAGKRFRDS